LLTYTHIAGPINLPKLRGEKLLNLRTIIRPKELAYAADFAIDEVA
jgi:hypothetical protein